MTLTKKQIKIIIDHTPAALKGKQIGWTGDTLGHFTPAGANWSYVAKYIYYNGAPLLVVTQFGEIL